MIDKKYIFLRSFCLLCLLLLEGPAVSSEDCEYVGLAELKEGNSKGPVLVFESPDNKRMSAYALHPRSESCNSRTCSWLSYLLPRLFSSQLATVVKYDDIEERIARGEVNFIKKWQVEKYYAQRTINKLEDDVSADYGYQANEHFLESWQRLKKLSAEEKKQYESSLSHMMIGHYCNYGNFSGYTNPAIYTLNILESFCEINHLSSNFNALKAQYPQETVTDLLYKATKDSKYNPYYKQP